MRTREVLDGLLAHRLRRDSHPFCSAIFCWGPGPGSGERLGAVCAHVEATPLSPKEVRPVDAIGLWCPGISQLFVYLFPRPLTAPEKKFIWALDTGIAASF